MVRTKAVSDPVEDTDGQRILVRRYWPRGRKREGLSIVEWCRNVAPSRELLRDWRDGGISWAEYEQRYLGEMQQQEAEIQRLAEMAAAGPLTLLCFEAEDDPHCHRHLLKALIEQDIQRLPGQS